MSEDRKALGCGVRGVGWETQRLDRQEVQVTPYDRCWARDMGKG